MSIAVKQSPRVSGIGIGVLIIFCIGAAIFSSQFHLQEDKRSLGGLHAKGNSLVSLLALYPLMDFDIRNKDFFLRTVSEYSSQGDLAYLFVHDADGEIRMSLSPPDQLGRIPPEIQSRSLHTLGLTQQSFAAAMPDRTIYEFAKPIFTDGQRTGTVRIGLRHPHSTFFSLNRISFMALLAFFIVATAALVYYSVTFAIRPLKKLNHSFKEAGMDTPLVCNQSLSSGRIAPILNDLESSLKQIRRRLGQIEEEKVELVAKLGVTAFEKKQIIRILDCINIGVIITDLHDRINHVNNYMLKLLDCPVQEVMGQPLTEILNQPQVTELLARSSSLEAGTGGGSIGIELSQAPGQNFQLSLAYLLDEEKTPIARMLSLKNVTHQKAAERAKQDFIAHVAHELLTPLTSIKSYSELLMDGEIEDQEMQKEFYNTINDQTDRLTDLIKNLLNLSKIEMGNLTLKKGLVKCDWLFGDCLKAIEGTARDKQITLVKEEPDRYPTLFGDKELLKAAVINILGNAVKYTPPSGTITFSLEEYDGMVAIDITDTGYGIAEKDQPFIFDKFYRSEQADITSQTGSGLGLALTSEIIQLHEGEIEVMSQVGAGTQFKIRLPKEEYRLGMQ